MSEENVLAATLVSAQVAEEHRRRPAHGAQVTVKTRLPGVTLAAFGAHEEGFARVLREEILGLGDRVEPYKIRREDVSKTVNAILSGRKRSSVLRQVRVCDRCSKAVSLLVQDFDVVSDKTHFLTLLKIWILKFHYNL